MVNENMLICESLKNSILHCEDGIRTGRIYMYTIYFAMIGFGTEYPWMFMVSFFVLIAFQSMINMDRLAIERMSCYLRIFFEEKRDDMHWELLNKDSDHLIPYQGIFRDFGWLINNAGASILAGVSTIATSIYSFQNVDDPNIFQTFHIDIIASILLFLVVARINRKIFINASKDAATISILESGIEKFYNKYSVEANKSKKSVAVRRKK